MSARRSCLLVLALLALAAACGVTEQDAAVRTSDDDVPFNLLAPDPTTTTTTTTTLPAAASEVVTVYLVEESHLAEVERRVPRPVDLADLVRAALVGPTAEEAEEGVVGVTLAGGVATIELSGRFTSVPVDDQLLALAQLVYTVTTRPGVGQVSFTVDGARVEVPRGDGSLTTETVARDDYAAYAPR